MATDLDQFVPGVDMLGLSAPVISGKGATYTLLPKDSGSIVLFDVATGVVYTLPAPSKGMFFDFIVSVSVTSNAHEVDTDAATTFIGGTVFVAKEATTPAVSIGPYFFSGTATSSVKISTNGSTTGGLIGSKFRMVAVSTTLWYITGMLLASGTPIVTPFA